MSLKPSRNSKRALGSDVFVAVYFGSFGINANDPMFNSVEQPSPNLPNLQEKITNLYI